MTLNKETNRKVKTYHLLFKNSQIPKTKKTAHNKPANSLFHDLFFYYQKLTDMKWIPYIAIWIYGIAVTGLGFASIYNPTNTDSVAEGRIPTDVFTFIGIIILYFAFASTKQYFHVEAREKKRFDLLIIAVLNIVVMVVPIIFLAWFTKNTFSNMSLYSEESGYYQALIAEFAILLVILASFLYNIKLFLYNK